MNCPACWIAVERGRMPQQDTHTTIMGNMYLERLFPVVSRYAHSRVDTMAYTTMGLAMKLVRITAMIR